MISTLRRQKQTGLAMVIVIWVLSLMTIMAGSFALTMRRETVVISAVKDNAEALAMAESGLALAQRMLLLMNNDKRWKADGSLYQIYYKEAEIRVRLFSEKGKIDINQADEKLLTLMMTSTTLKLDEQQALVSAILDWRDDDELVRINGAERSQYEEAGLSYQPTNKDFNSIEELQMVLGMNGAVFEELQPIITVYSMQPNVDMDVAPIEVQFVIANLDSLSFEEYIAQQIESAEIQSGATDEIQSGDTGINRQANSNNNVYTIISQARLSSDAEASIKVTIKKNANGRALVPFQMLDYQQLYQGYSLFSQEMEQFIVAEEDESEFEY